jgi:hypothetical protein
MYVPVHSIHLKNSLATRLDCFPLSDLLGSVAPDIDGEPGQYDPY